MHVCRHKEIFLFSPLTKEIPQRYAPRTSAEKATGHHHSFGRLALYPAEPHIFLPEKTRREIFPRSLKAQLDPRTAPPTPANLRTQETARNRPRKPRGFSLMPLRPEEYPPPPISLKPP